VAAFAGLARPAAAQGLPVYSHIIIIWEENKDYGDVIGSASAPYINNTLLGTYGGANFTQMHSEYHPSQPNYLCFSSGSNQGVLDDGTYDVPAMTTPNLFAKLRAAGYSFKGYAEDLPSVGYTGASYTYQSGTNEYVEKHCPWVNWQGTGTNQIPSSCNVPYATATDNPGHLSSSYYFPANFNLLPTVAMVVPNEQNEMHDGTVSQADTWLKQNMDAYVQWARTHNSLLILAWDENDGSNPATGTPIPWVAVGANVKPGNYSESINQYNWLRTIENMYGLGTCTGNDAGATPVTDAFSTALTWTGSASGNWNALENNWKNVGLSALYFNGAQVTFDDSGANTNITIQSAGISPASLAFLNTTAKSYTLGGGPIAGTCGVSISGGGQVTLTGSNTYSGGTTLAGGKLVLGNAQALGQSTLDLSGGSVGFSSLTAVTLGGLSGSGPLALVNSASLPVALSVGNNSVNTIYSGVLSGRGSLAKVGGGTLTLTAGNSYSGGTSVTGGVLVAENAAALPSGARLVIGSSGSVVLGGVGYAELGSLLDGAPAGDSTPPAPTGGANVAPEPRTVLLLAAAACALCVLAARRRGAPCVGGE
jgi:autotransporter-associated beta strand protein